MLPIILASSSKYRASLLKQLELPFEQFSPDIDESPLKDERPEDLVQRLSQEKAKKVSETYKNHLIIASDQVGWCGDSILTKPGTRDKAIEQLSHLSGKTVSFYTGLCVLNSASNGIQLCLNQTDVKFRELDPELIRNYVQREQPLDCAGAFKVEGLGIALFERVEGKDPNSLIGLPLIDLVSMLTNEGVEVLCGS